MFRRQHTVANAEIDDHQVAVELEVIGGLDDFQHFGGRQQTEFSDLAVGVHRLETGRQFVASTP